MGVRFPLGAPDFFGPVRPRSPWIADFLFLPRHGTELFSGGGSISAMENHTCWNPFRSWDPWPLTRLLLVLAALSCWAHWCLGWALPAPLALGRAAFGLFEVFCLSALIGLAQVYLVVLAFPVYATIVLNDWFYDGCYWLLGLAGPRSPRWRAGFALVGELGLFVSLWRSMELLLKSGF